MSFKDVYICTYPSTESAQSLCAASLGRLQPPRQPLRLVEDADHHLNPYPRGYRGPTDRYPTSQRPPHGYSGSPPHLASDSHQKAASDSHRKAASASLHAPGPDSPPMLASVSPPKSGPASPPVPVSVPTPQPASASPRSVTVEIYHPASHYQGYTSTVHYT